MQIAVIILNWNGRALLEQFLPSVVTHSSQQAQIYVADNASTDDSIVFLENHYPTVKIIKNQKNYGYAQGYNQALSGLQEDIFVLLNSDVEVTAGWLNPIHRLFADPKIAAVQPKILDYKRPTYFEYAGAGGGFIDNFGYPYCRGRIFWTLEEDKGQFNDTIQTFWASGACLFIRTKDFVDSGGFDEGFFAHMEEIDLCWRLNNSGRKVFYCGASTVYHLGGGTLRSNNPRKTYLNFRNSLWMLVKNLPSGKTFPFVFARLSLDGITGIVFWIYEGFPHLWAVVDSHFGFYKRLSHYRKIRKPGRKDYFHKRNVPFQYFVLKRKHYRDLR